MVLRRELQDGVAFVTLDRPEAANSLNVALREELVRTWEWLNGEPQVRAVVLTGAGERTFCAGSDLNDRGLDAIDYLADERYGSPPREHFMRRMRWAKPTVCAINGHALGGGLELALAADIRIAARTAMLGMPEVRVGSMPGAGATQLLPRGIGLSAANYLLLTGESIPAEKALQFGLVTEVLDPADLLPRAIAIADRIARNAPLSVRATRDAVTVGLDLPLAQGLEYERHLFGLIRATADRAEGRAAFRERRDPRFEGR